jgi:hypothetical protein
MLHHLAILEFFYVTTLNEHCFYRSTLGNCHLQGQEGESGRVGPPGIQGFEGPPGIYDPTFDEEGQFGVIGPQGPIGKRSDV